MNKNINGNDLIALGYKPGPILGAALRVNKKRTGFTKIEMLDQYKKVLDNPEEYLDNKLFSKLATALIEGLKVSENDLIKLRENTDDFKIYGRSCIEEGALKQMSVAMKLPVTIAGALMPDAHQGYGLPIGGVLATKDAVIPYGVGVDIGCRMALSIYDIPEDFLLKNGGFLKEQLVAQTKFGAGNGFQGAYKAKHAVLDNPAFEMTPFIRNLKDKAWAQLGTSGGGNHFVEFGIIIFKEDDTRLNIPKGKYVALLSHSGSRGLGATIAGYYTRLAKSLCKLPAEAANLAYLDMATEAGQEYWMAMNLAGDYASACHEVIHHKMANALGGSILARVENHHNFAWKETLNGDEVIVHRKGATPAAKGVLGIIPGSMTAPGFLVRGKGEEQSIHSAAHGAGRQMSRTQAIKSISQSDMQSVLAQSGVSLIGAGMDEAPMAYKDIHAVMEAQTDLVDVVATFMPKIVRMADDGSRED